MSGLKKGAKAHKKLGFGLNDRIGSMMFLSALLTALVFFVALEVG